MLSAWLAHPLTRGLDIDAPETTQLRRQIIRKKAFLREVYKEWYTRIADATPRGPGAVLELGSGAGFLKRYIPDLITSEIFPVEGVDRVVDARQLPFADGSLRAIVMTNVFHHLSEPTQFLDEATRCIRPGGRLLLIEPWNTFWARRVYRSLHHEPFEPAVKEWGFTGMGPLSDANGALPWIVFHRDRDRFAELYPQWRVRSIREIMPLRYLVSGGVSLRFGAPKWSFKLLKAWEACLKPWRHHLGMFALIKLERLAVESPVSAQDVSRRLHIA